MSVIIFGNGPLPIEAQFPVMAPGSRTWQIIKTVAAALADQNALNEEITVFGLDEHERSAGSPATINTVVKATDKSITLSYHALPYEQFIQAATADPGAGITPDTIRAVIGTGSVQPYATAAKFAERHDVPLWIDVFGDPISELQSQAELASDPNAPDVTTKMVHVWKLLTDALLQGDRFSALSERQRFALLGQLGCVGRLNQHTATINLVSALPYALFTDELSPQLPVESTDGSFNVMWCGSFNTWMDVPTLTKGITDALRSTPNMRLVVVGGMIPGYNETSYNEFLTGIRQAGVEGAVTLMNWQPLSAMQELYRRCDLGISIDRYTYEAELGSRTRLINFLSAGVPVASTVVTELSQHLLHAGQLLPFELGSAESLTDTLISAASLGSGSKAENAKSAIRHIYTTYNGNTIGAPLKEWIITPYRALDKRKTDTNGLINHTIRIRASLGA